MATKTSPSSSELGNDPGQEEYQKLTARFNSDNKDNHAAGNPTDPRGNDTASGDRSDPGDKLSPDEIKDKEESGGSPEPGNFNSADSSGLQPGEKSFYKKPGGNKPSIRGRVFGRRTAILSAVAAALISAVVALFSFFLPSLKLPELQHSMAKRLTRSARTFNDNASILTAEKTAIDSAGSAADAAANEKLVSSSPLGKALDTYKPMRVINNMKGGEILKFSYKPGPLGTQIIEEVKIGNSSIPAPELKFGRLISNHNKIVNFGKDINAATTDVLRNQDAGYMVRTQVSKRLLGSLGISLKWWQRKGADERGKTLQQATQEEQLRLFDEVNTSSEGSVTEGVSETKNKALEQERACLQDASCSKKVADGQLSLLEASGADKTINSYVDRIKTFGNTLGTFSTFYAVAVPVCIVYDGSVETSKLYIEAQQSAWLKTFFALSIAADQQNYGDTSAEGVQALNNLVGDITNTNPEKNARGEPIDAALVASGESSRVNGYSIFDVIFPPGVKTAAKWTASKLCPYVLNWKVAVGVITAQVATALIPGLGSAEAAEGAAGTAAQGVVKKIITDALSHFTDPLKRKALQNSGMKFALTQGGIIGATDALTYGSRMLVLSEMGALASGADYLNLANQGDAGAVQYNNVLNQQELFGRPMTNKEVLASGATDNLYIARQKNRQSIYQRYIAISNPGSLANNLAVMVSSKMNWSSIHQIPSLIGNLPQMFSTIFRPFASMISGHTLAASSIINSYYGTVQWGWTPQEQNLIDNDSSYDPLVNGQILNSPANHDVVYGSGGIAETYGKCFTEDTASLLSDGSLKRDGGGNLLDSGLCSPTNLGLNNPKYGDLVFRWRYDQSLQSTLHELLDTQVTGTTTSTTGVSG